MEKKTKEELLIDVYKGICKKVHADKLDFDTVGSDAFICGKKWLHGTEHIIGFYFGSNDGLYWRISKTDAKEMCKDNRCLDLAITKMFIDAGKEEDIFADCQDDFGVLIWKKGMSVEEFLISCDLDDTSENDEDA